MVTKKSSSTKDSKQRPTTRFFAGASGSLLESLLQRAGLSTRQAGHWTIVGKEIVAENNQTKILCRCKCGIEKLVVLPWLVNGRTTQCQSCSTTQTHKSAGHFIADTPAKKRLQKRVGAMKCRCENPRDQSYKNYGGRGIRFCFASVKSCAEYILENLPHESYLGVDIDRKNNEGHYEPGNLQLVSRRRNLRNTRRTVLVFWQGSLVPLQDWKENPYALTTAGRYVAQGLTGEEILQKAQQAVVEKRKGWKNLQRKLNRSTTS